MNRFENLEKELKRQGVRGFLPAQNIIFIAGKDTAKVLFHTYNNADKALPILKEMGYTLKTGRERNLENAYFKYFVAIQ